MTRMNHVIHSTDLDPVLFIEPLLKLVLPVEHGVEGTDHHACFDPGDLVCQQRVDQRDALKIQQEPHVKHNDESVTVNNNDILDHTL